MIAALLCGVAVSSAQKKADVTKQSIGKLKVSLIFGTDGEAQKGMKKVTGDRLKNLKTIKFSNFYLMGEDTQPVLKRYINWANPIKGSKQILLSFQPGGKPMENTLKMDLELWIAQKKVMKSVDNLTTGKPVYIQGPAWRGGKLIVVAELLDLK